MAITSICVFLIISPLFLAGIIQGDLTESFTEDVQNALPESDFSKLFKVNTDSVDDIIQALKDAGKAFSDILNADVPDNLRQEFINRAQKFINITPEQLLRVNAGGLSGTLSDQGILNADNERDIADSYVNELRDAADNLEDDKVSHIFPALSKASANVLKSNGLVGFGLVVRNLANNMLRELDTIGN